MQQFSLLAELAISEVTLDSQGSAIYKGSFAPSNQEPVMVRGIPKNLVPASVRIPKHPTLRLTASKLYTPQDYSRMLGEGVQVRVTTPQANYYGLLIEHRDRNLKLLVDKMIVEIEGPFEIIYPRPSLGEAFVNLREPTLQLVANQPLTNFSRVNLSFRAYGLQWSGTHRLGIQTQQRTLDWEFVLTLDNQTDLELREIELNLLVADSLKPGYYAAARSLPSSVFGGRGVQESSSGNTLIPVGKIGRIPRGESAMVIYHATGIPFDSALVYSISRGAKHPSRVINFRQPGDRSMAFPAAAGEWNLDEADFGTFNLEYLAPRQTCRLDLGAFSLVEVQSRARNVNLARKEIMLSFKNNATRPLVVLVEMTDTRYNPVFEKFGAKDAEDLKFFEDGLLQTTLVVKTGLIQPGQVGIITYTEDIPPHEQG